MTANGQSEQETRARLVQSLQHRFEIEALEKRLRFYAQLARAERFGSQLAGRKLKALESAQPSGIAGRLARKIGKGQSNPQSARELTPLQREILKSGVFDADWYRRRYPDIGESTEPFDHYLRNAVAELRDPNPSFSTSYYLDRYGLPPLGNAVADYLSSEGNRRRRTSEYGAVDNPGRMRIVFISTSEPHEPGHRYRIEDVAAALVPFDVEVVITRTHEFPSRMHEVRNCDLVWMWRQQLRPGIRRVIKTAKANGIPIVADIDDLIFDEEMIDKDLIDGIRSQGEDLERVRDRFRRMRSVLEAANVLTTTTEPLRGELRRINDRVFVIPNGYDERSWHVSALAGALREPDGLIRLGYAAGTKTHQRDFALVAGVVAEILAGNPATRLVLFKGTLDVDEFPQLQAVSTQIEWRDLVPLEQLPLEYARFDVNLAPLEAGNVFCESKSSLKYFEAALVHVPTVASPTQPFQEAIDDGRTGFLAADADQWRQALTTLVQDAALRQQLAARAFVDAVQRFGPVRRVALVGEVVAQVLSRPLPSPSESAGSKPEYVAPVSVELNRLDSQATVFLPRTVPFDVSLAELASECDLVVAEDHPQLEQLRSLGWVAVTTVTSTQPDNLPSIALHASTGQLLAVKDSQVPADARQRLEDAALQLDLHRDKSVELPPWADLHDVFQLLG